MTAKELDKVFKLCVKFGISELKTGDTHVIFGELSQKPRKPRKAAIKEQKDVAEKASLQTQHDHAQAEIEVSHIENPLEFEEALAAGMLTREETDDKRTEPAL